MTWGSKHENNDKTQILLAAVVVVIVQKLLFQTFDAHVETRFGTILEILHILQSVMHYDLDLSSIQIYQECGIAIPMYLNFSRHISKHSSVQKDADVGNRGLNIENVFT